VSEPQVAADRPGSRRARLWFGLAALAALVVTIVFLTIGDGVDVVEATGVRMFVVEYAHTAVWGLLTVAFAAAAWAGEWRRLSNATAVAAGVLYAVFLFAVLFWP
jgi:hypothetical protein